MTDSFSPTDSRQRIWQVVNAIPAGRVCSYGQVARLAGLGRGARQAGHALRNLPAGTRIPWHRVINSQGKLSLPPGSDGHYTQMQRLLAEGVEFTERGRIASPAFWWPDP